MLGFTVRVSFRQCPWSFLLKTGIELWSRFSFCFVLKFPDWKWHWTWPWLSLCLILTDVLQILLCLNVCHWYIPFGARQRWRLHVWHLLIIIVTITVCVDECMYVCAHCMWVCISVRVSVSHRLLAFCDVDVSVCQPCAMNKYRTDITQLYSHCDLISVICSKHVMYNGSFVNKRLMMAASLCLYVCAHA